MSHDLEVLFSNVMIRFRNEEKLYKNKLIANNNFSIFKR